MGVAAVAAVANGRSCVSDPHAAQRRVLGRSAVIVLYNPVSSASKKPVLPMSLLSLGALLEGVEDYCIVDGNLVADGLSALRDALRATKADILAMTVMPGPQLSNAA